MTEQCVSWPQKLLWPTELPAAAVIDMTDVESLGVWAHEWFRQRPQQIVLRASKSIQEQLCAAKLPILWYSHESEVPILNGGVSPSEREMLWS